MNSVFPAVYSTLDPKALSALLSEQYGITDVQCKLLVRGVGDTYLVESSEGRSILRVYRADHRTLPQINEEVELLLALKDAGVSVAYPLPDISGSVVQHITAVEGERHAVLFSFARGHAVRIPDGNQLRIFGREMARFHNVSSVVPKGGARWQFDPETTLFRPLEMLRSAFVSDPENYDWLQVTASHITEKLSQSDTSGFSTGYCHFDFLPKNMHFDGDLVTFFDFDFMGYGWLVYDIMSFWQHLILEVYAGRMTPDTANNAYAIFLQGYRENRSITEQELAWVPYLAIGFWLFYMGFHTTHDQFSAFSQPAQLKVFTGFLKHLVATHWAQEEL